jgi:hypothetical protein
LKYEELELKLKKHDFKYKPYIHISIDNKNIRKQLIKNITEDNHINIYYNSYHLVYEASKEHPELFYPYWDSLVPLLNHKNSYHRSISHDILTNLIQVDNDNKFDLIQEKYFSMIKDEKFSTGLGALRNIFLVSEYRPDLKNKIVIILLNKDLLTNYKENQVNRMQFEIIEFLGKTTISENKNNVINYIINSKESNNSRIKKIAEYALKSLNNS